MRAWSVRLGELYFVGRRLVRVESITSPHPTDGSLRQWKFHCLQIDDGKTVVTVANKLRRLK